MKKCMFTFLPAALVILAVSSWAQTESGGLQKHPGGVQYITIDYPGSVTTTGAFDISPDGEIVGNYTGPDSVAYSFVTNGRTFRTLNLSDSFRVGRILRTWLQKLTPGGTSIVGTVVTEGACPGCPDFMFQGQYYGVVLNKGQVTKLQYPNAAYTTAYAITCSGEVAGEYMIAGLAHGYRWSHGNFTTVDFPGAAWSSVLGINNHGEVTGWYTNHPDLTHPFHGYVLSKGRKYTIDGPGSNWTIAYDINDRGDVVGMYVGADGVHGFLWRDGIVTTIDVPGAKGTQIYGINDRGDMVGWYTTNGADSHGVLITK
jgi:probable HAF family extracellular repeat protein